MAPLGRLVVATAVAGCAAAKPGVRWVNSNKHTPSPAITSDVFPTEATPVAWDLSPPHWLSPCAATSYAFQVPVCLSNASVSACSLESCSCAPKQNGVGKTCTCATPTKCDHVANILLQLLDNDADGKVDDPAVLMHMRRKHYFMFVVATWRDYKDHEQSWIPDTGVSSAVGLWEVFAKSCIVPSNRGASDTDRGTWSSAVHNGPGLCNHKRDATIEETFHLITDAASQLWPAEWGVSFGSLVGSLLSASNGDCGWGFEHNWKNPCNGSCVGQYAYNDPTCGEACLVMEGVYWVTMSAVGGLFTDSIAKFAQREFLMCTPQGTPVLPSSDCPNKRTLQEGSPLLYQMVMDTTSIGHAWLPAVMPNGEYKGPKVQASSLLFP